ncbi:MAG: hypothetical protein IPK35_04195 [Saprospiraceae bacterium]|jgi:hypothetical protein|nr:hypothetical protein [Saprospiraceae bacterium]
MYRYLQLSSLTLCVCLIGCGEKKSEPTTENPKSEISSGPMIPGINQETYTKLLDSCSNIDYIFHDMPFSLSQSDDPDINQNIMFIDISKPVGQLVPGCKPIGRKFFQIKGNIVYDADVYLSDKCNFYVFVDKSNKPLFANQMTESGRNFYNNIIKQVTGATSTGTQ